MPPRLVLASTSPYRQAQLRRLGVTFTAVAPRYDEVPVPGLDARALIRAHARQKALCVRSLPALSDAWILAADQGAVIDSPQGPELLGKPGTLDTAVMQLLRLAGREHELRAAVVLALPDGRVLERESVILVRVRSLSEAEARAYVALDEPLDCAGSYRIEAAGPSILDYARGDDPTSIEGLPLMAVAAMLREAGLN